MFKYYWRNFGYEEYQCAQWWMVTQRRGYYRHQRVSQEQKRWFKDIEEDVKLRRRRAANRLDIWSDLEKMPSCYLTKSWKKLSKRKKQWKA
jgi:hypothetical protein